MEGDPYLISTADDLAEFRNKVNNGENSAWGVLTNNIDLSTLTNEEQRSNWTPIGKDNSTTGIISMYKGTFDGCGYTISNLSVDGELVVCRPLRI